MENNESRLQHQTKCHTSEFTINLRARSLIMASQASHERDGETRPSHEFASPFECGSRMTSRDHPKWRTCSQANSRSVLINVLTKGLCSVASCSIAG